MSTETRKCPHCGGELSKWAAPEDSSWGTGMQLVCFSDDCPYYVRGWEWMKDQFQQHASYRYRYNTENGEEGPLPVWSKDALKDGLIDDGEEK